jgi:septal ring factor EnvC (AmiA/AmiB activator)
MAAMEADLAQLEQKLASLIAHTRALRAANEDLRAKLAQAGERERTLEVRMRAARERLDALLARMPAD